MANKLTLSQQKSLAITPVVSGMMSLIGSGTLIVMILKSELKLNAPLRRIFFGLCVYDVIMSVGAALSSLPIPVNQGIWGASGNVYSCNFQGFINQIGFAGSILYNGSLCLYYVCVIKFGMSEDTFRSKVEPIFHIISNFYPFFGAIYLLSRGYLNSAGNLCWISASPPACLVNPKIQCVRGDDKAFVYRFIFLRVVLIGVYIMITISMILIVAKVISQKRKGDRWASGGTGRRSTSSTTDDNRRTSTGAGSGTGRSGSEREREGERRDEPKSLHSSSSSNRHKNIEVPGSSSKVVEPPPVFNLSAMRAKTRNMSLIMPREFNIDANGKPTSETGNKSRDDAVSGLLSPLSQAKEIEIDCKQGGDNELESELTNDEKASAGGLRKSMVDEESTIGDGNDDGIEENKLSNRKSTLRYFSSIDSGRNSVSSSAKPPNRGPSRQASREAMTQALLYIFSFLLTWAFPMTFRVLEGAKKPIPFWLKQAARMFNPLQGFFNVFIYCRPHVLAVKRANPEYSWSKAMYLVVRSGGDNNSAGQGRRNAPLGKSYKASKKMQARIELEHRQRMESIRQKRMSAYGLVSVGSTPRNSIAGGCTPSNANESSFVSIGIPACALEEELPEIVKYGQNDDANVDCTIEDTDDGVYTVTRGSTEEVLKIDLKSPL